MNRHSALLALAAASLIARRQPDATDEPTCVAHWRFENGVRDVAAGENRLIVDDSGNAQNGFAIGRPIFRRVDAPTSNFALEFQDDAQRVWVPDDPGFELSGSITVEAWVQVDHLVASTHQRQIVFRGDVRPGLDPWYLAIARHRPAVVPDRRWLPSPRGGDDVRLAARLGGDDACIGIGNLGHGGDQGFRGRIAEVRICAAALSPERFVLAALR